MEENQVGNERPSIEFVLKRFGGQDAFRRLVVMHHQCFLDEGSAEFVLVAVRRLFSSQIRVKSLKTHPFCG